MFCVSLGALLWMVWSMWVAQFLVVDVVGSRVVWSVSLSRWEFVCSGRSCWWWAAGKYLWGPEGRAARLRARASWGRRVELARGVPTCRLEVCR